MDPNDLDYGELKLEEYFDGLTITEDRFSQKTSGDASLRTTSDVKGRSIKKTARSMLHDICVANCWKPPDFRCCQEEGLGHLKSFTFKVIVEIGEAPYMILECYGKPKSTKEGAVEHAAQAAVWYLEHAVFQ